MRTTPAALLLSLALLAVPAAAAAAPPGSDDPSRAAPGQVIVGFKPGVDEAQRQRAAERVKAVKREKISKLDQRVEVFKLPGGQRNSQAIDELASDPAVEFAEPDWKVQPIATSTDSYFTGGRLWGLYGDATSPANVYGSQAGEAWAAGHTGSSAVYVGVIDEGIQYTHPDLAGNVWTNPSDPVDGRDNDGNGYVDDVRGWDFANNDNSIYDGGSRGHLDDHGTHVAGTIGARANNGGVVGVNWNVTLISGKFLGRNGGLISNAVRAVDYFTDLRRRGLNVVATNNSWGGGGYSTAFANALARANDANVLFVAAAGNSGANNDTTASYPSNYLHANVIAVAAIDNAGRLASFSQYGRTTVDLGAPGVGVWSTTAFSGYSSYNGTSMATPHVTGAAALYASTRGGASAATIKGAILGSAAATPSLANKTVTGGRLDASGF